MENWIWYYYFFLLTQITFLKPENKINMDLRSRNNVFLHRFPNMARMGRPIRLVHPIPDAMDMVQEPPLVQFQVPANTVTACQKCPSKNAKSLTIHDISYKLQHMESYDIGGTWTDSEPDLWFYFSTSICPGNNYLLNVFVCHRKMGNFSVGLSNSKELSLKRKRNETSDTASITLPDDLIWFTFTSAVPDESHFLKSYCFKATDLRTLENNNLIIPIGIELNSMNSLDNDVIKRIKLNHDFGDLLVKQEKTDFILEVASRKQFPTHRIILAAHSPVLRDMLKNDASTSAFIDIADGDMELLLQFIYTGTIKDVQKQDCLKLLEIADRFQLKNLFLLTQFAINEQINVNNAVDIAIISEKYNLVQLQNAVFNFIRYNPSVLETEGWLNLNDVVLTKKLLQYMHKNKARD